MGRGWLCQGGVIAGARGLQGHPKSGQVQGLPPASSKMDHGAASLSGRWRPESPNRVPKRPRPGGVTCSNSRENQTRTRYSFQDAPDFGPRRTAEASSRRLATLVAAGAERPPRG